MRSHEKTFNIDIHFALFALVTHAYYFLEIHVNRAYHQPFWVLHYSDVIMGSMASQLTSLTVVNSTVYSVEIIQWRSKKTSTLRVTGLCVGNSPITGEFPAQMASTAENVSIWWRHHDHARTLLGFSSHYNWFRLNNWAGTSFMHTYILLGRFSDIGMMVRLLSADEG